LIISLLWDFTNKDRLEPIEKAEGGQSDNGLQVALKISQVIVWLVCNSGDWLHANNLKAVVLTCLTAGLEELCNLKDFTI
jgi:hypothetical protein